MSEAQIPDICYKRAAEQMAKWGIRPTYLSAVVGDVVRAVFEAKRRYDEVEGEVARKYPQGEIEYATCRGCGQQTIYEVYCSDCQVDIEQGLKPGTFSVDEGIKSAEWETRNHA